MVSAAALALIKLIQIPGLIGNLNLGGNLYPPERNVANNSCHDYIVVGGGTAGCAVAGRLSENPKTTVLLLERGENPPLLSFFPPAFALFAGSKYDQNYSSTFDSYAASSQYNYTKLSAGNVLGGTSSINHLVIARGHCSDYDEWAKIADDPSWKYKNVFKYFLKKEKLEDPGIYNSIYRPLHGLNGPGAITRQPKAYSNRYLEALNETGSPTPLDITRGIGYADSLFILNSKGIRQNTAFTYLTPVRLRSNLFVLRKTRVILIIFDKKKAVAVVAIRNGKTYVYRASKEIIICAGVFDSPKLLMLSGVGPRKHLESLNIRVKADLPVGKNFQDQVAVPLVHKMEANISPPPQSSVNLFQFPFPIILGLAALKEHQPYADYQMFLLLFPANTPQLQSTCSVVFQFRADLCDELNKANILHNSLFAFLTITQPLSRGHVKLRSTDPYDAPLITTGYFKNKTDLDNIVNYIEHYLKIENSTYFKNVKAELANPNLEQCKQYAFRTKDYWKCYVLHSAGSVYHNCGTCALGSVVDCKLRVYNVTNLRVVDASVMPTLINGSPYEAVQMIAEKASDMIKADTDKYLTCKKLYNTEENCSGDDDTNNETKSKSSNKSVSNGKCFCKQGTNGKQSSNNKR